MSRQLEFSFRALFYDEISEYNEIIKSLIQSTEFDRNTHLHNNLGVAYFEVGNNEDAQIHFDKSIELDSFNTNALLNRAELHIKRNQMEKAEIDLNNAFRINPNSTSILRTRAYFFKELGRLKKALLDLKEAAKLDPDHQYTLKEIERIENTLKRKNGE